MPRDLLRLTTAEQEALRQHEPLSFTWSELGLILGVLLLVCVWLGNDYRRFR